MAMHSGLKHVPILNDYARPICEFPDVGQSGVLSFSERCVINEYCFMYVNVIKTNILQYGTQWELS